MFKEIKWNDFKKNNQSKKKVDIEEFSEFDDDVKRFVSMRNDGNWSEYRSPVDRFDLVEVDYVFGKRNVYVPQKDSFNINLQESRGIGIAPDDHLTDVVEKAYSTLDSIEEGDMLRITELDQVIKKLNYEPASFCEIGFRVPKLQKFYKDNRSMSEAGFEINDFNIKLGRKMGYNCFRINLLEDKDYLTPNKLEKFDIIVGYHVLEHVHDPMTALKVIKNLCHSKTILHIEIPIEPGIPRLKYGHLFPFDEKDLEHMLKMSGFEILSYSTKVHTGGPQIERYSARPSEL